MDLLVASCRGTPIVQPRMGFSDIAVMRGGLLDVKSLPFPTMGTITLDSFTRTGHLGKAAEAVRKRQPLNGFPLLAYPAAVVRDMLAGIHGPGFPVQVRHGTPLPLPIFRALREIGIGATEGGPVSYCLPYGQVPLEKSLASWAASCELFAEMGDLDHPAHLESFGGCMMGQLGAPSLLVAISLLEALFFEQHGVRSVSLSYAQGTNLAQDAGAIAALRRLAGKHLRHRFHVVLYMYMGLFPRSFEGARHLIDSCAMLARRTGCERLIVKTASEAHRIPTIEENLLALRWASESARLEIEPATGPADEHEEITLEEASSIVDRVLDLHADVGVAIREAFRRGLLDVPYCLHPDNRGLARTMFAPDGVVRWADVGELPVRAPKRGAASARGPSSAGLIDALSFYRRTLDPGEREVVEAPDSPEPVARGRAVLTTIPSDSHSWNLIFLELFLREHGYEVTNLGMCVPVEVTLEVCRREEPELVVVSTVNGHGYLEGAEIARAVRGEGVLAGVRLVLGGLIHSDPEIAEQQTARLCEAGFDHVYHGDAGVAAFREMLAGERSRTSGRAGRLRIAMPPDDIALEDAQEHEASSRHEADVPRVRRVVPPPRIS
ncbi:cobalamin-dependent protein [Polyangium sorediatum]|uniref:Cobalamin-dependent protein n=1 Tax=Polyangium sorediatum TaxID=889274 RepID=A0ABT6NYG0_9BACT|nr:cobalamin-dependent protein [Polyangium sorediatum]